MKGLPMSTSATPPAKKLVDDFSLEMTGKDVEALEAAAHLIPQGTRINVTFLGNEDLDMRTNAAAAVRRLGFDPVPHISARRISSESELTDFLQALKEAAAPTKVFAVGGDPETPMGPYEDSLSLIETGLFPQYGITEVNIAGYPEGTPVIADDVLWDHLQRKDRALKEQGLDGTILTQFSFVRPLPHQPAGHGRPRPLHQRPRERAHRGIRRRQAALLHFWRPLRDRGMDPGFPPLIEHLNTEGRRRSLSYVVVLR